MKTKNAISKGLILRFKLFIKCLLLVGLVIIGCMAIIGTGGGGGGSGNSGTLGGAGK